MNRDIWSSTVLKKLLIAASVSLLCIGLAVAAPSRAIKRVDDLNHNSGKLGRYRALVIGINEYEDAQIGNLETAVKDARVMAELLETRYGFEVDDLINAEATWDAIDKSLRRLTARSQPDDSVLIYFAGHGQLDREYNDGWWIPADARFGKRRTYLRNTEVQKAISNMPARHVLIISDSCYSGTLFGKARGMPAEITEKYYLDLYNEKSRWGMTSGNIEPVSDRGSKGHSVFAYQLIKALKGNPQPYITTQEIYTQIAPIVGNNSEQTPKALPIRNSGDLGGQFVFVASSGAVVERPTAMPEGTTLSIESNINGAEVFLDGRKIGTTPLVDYSVTAGSHRLQVQKPGYESYQRTLNFQAGRSQSLYVDLRVDGPSTGRLYVDTEPEDATVKILNIQPRFFQGIELDPGSYEVEVSASGYNKKRLTARLKAGEDKYLEVRLERRQSASGDAKIRNSLGMEFVYIEPGTFMMGSPSNEKGRDDDESRHQVTLTRGYYLQTTEVTQGQWKAVMGSNPSYYDSCGDDCPVEKVSWNDVQEFINKLNRKEGTNVYRLPTEAEWEYAARAGTTTPFAFGNCLSTDQANYDGNYPLDGCSKGKYRRKTMTVGSLSPNAWGLYDMHGNVWEWCQDRYGDYPSGSVTDPTGPSSGSARVIRGGSWGSYASYCRSARRFDFTPGHSDFDLGFRLARTE